MNMNRIRIVSIFIFSLFLYPCNAQSKISISTPEISLSDNNIIIGYNILNSSSDQEFNVNIEITDINGSPLQARSLSGDLGPGISGGMNKVINWNLTADNIYLDANLYFEVIAELTSGTKVPDNITALNNSDKSYSEKELTRKDVIAQSLLFPGLGMTKLKGGSPHWIKGAAGYSCLVGSIGFFSLSNMNENRQDQGQEYYDKSVNQWYTAQTLLFSAIGVWVVDVIWNLAGTRDSGNDASLSYSKGISFHTAYHPETRSPGIALTYRF